MKNYEEGEVLYSLDEIVKQECIFCRGELYHKSWFSCWQLYQLMLNVDAGHIRRAIDRRATNEE